MATLSFDIPDKLFADLQTVCDITNSSIENDLKNAVERCVAIYRNQNGVVKPIKAIYLEHTVPAEVQAYKNEGKEIPEIVKRNCYFLYYTTIFKAPYAAIVLNGQFLKVPANCVAFPA